MEPIPPLKQSPAIGNFAGPPSGTVARCRSLARPATSTDALPLSLALYSGRPWRQQQAGFLMIETALALMIALLMAVLAFWSVHRAEQATRAMSQADTIASVAKAAETLVLEKYTDYQRGNPITRNGVTLNFGTSVGDALAPTIANLRDMATGLTPGSDFGSFKSLASASFQISIERVPPLCENTPNGQSCNLRGLVCMDLPVQDPGAPATDIDGLALGIMVGKLGGDGGMSLPGMADQIIGAGGAWSAPNPVTQTPAGIICQRFGFGSAGFAQFLRVADTRDPNFQGGLTLSGALPGGESLLVNGSATILGNTSIVGNTSVVGNAGVLDSLSGCIKAGLASAGASSGGLAFVTNSACVQTVQLNGQTGTVTATGAVVVTNAAGNVVGSINADGTVVANQRLEAPVAKLSAAHVPDSSCIAGDENDVAQNAASAGLVVCRSGNWVAVGTRLAATGTTCTVNGALAESSTGQSLMCVGNVWQTTTSRMGKFATAGFYLASHGQTVPKPACGSGGVPNLVEVPQGIDARTLSTNFTFVDMGASWQILIDDNAGNARAGSTKVQTGCWYN